MVLKTIREKPGYRYNWLGAEGVSPTQQRKGRTTLKRAESSLSSCPYDERSSQNVVPKNKGKTVDLGDYTLEMDGKKEEITIQFSPNRNSSRLNSCGGNQNQNNAFPSVFLLEECGKSAASDETTKRQNTGGWGNDDDLPSSLPPSACCDENKFATSSGGDSTRKSRSLSEKGWAEESSSKHSNNRLKAVQERLKSQNAKMKDRLKRQKKEMKKRLECQRKKMLEMDILPCTGTWFNSGVSASSSGSTTSSGSSTASCSYQLTLSEYQTEREDKGARKENDALTPSSSSSLQSHQKRRALNLPVTGTPPLTTSTTTQHHPRSSSNGENRQPDEIFKTSDPHVESQLNQMIEIQESPSFTGPWWSSSQSWQFLEDFDDEGAVGESKIDYETASTMRQSYNNDSRRISRVDERLSSISDPSPSSNEEMMMMRRRHKISTIIDENIRQPEELKKKLSTIFNENIKRPEEMKKRLQNQRKKMKNKIEMSPRVTPRLSSWRATHKSLLDPSWDASEETKLDASTRTEDLPIPTTNHHHRHRRHRLPVSAVDYQKPPQPNLHNEKKRKPSIIHQLVADEVRKPYDLTEKRKQSSSPKKNSVRFSSKLMEQEYVSIGSIPSNDSCDSGCAPCKTFSSETQFQDTSSVSLNIGIDNGGDSSDMSFCRRFGEACESIYVKIFDDEEDFVDTTIPPPRVIVSSNNNQQRHPSRQSMDSTFRSDLMCCWQGGSSSSGPTEEVAGECCRINSSSSSLASSISSTSSFIKDKNRRKNWFQDPRAHCDTSSRRHNTNDKNKVNIYAENKPTADNGDGSNREAGRHSSRVDVAVQSKNNNNKFPLPRHSRKASKKETTTDRHHPTTSDSASANLGCKVPSGATILNKSSIINHTNQGRSQKEDTDRTNGGFWQAATKLGRQFNIEIPKPLKSRKVAGAPKKWGGNVDNRRSRHNKEITPSNTAKKGGGSWWKAAGNSLSSFMACTNEEILMENIQDDDDDDDIFASEFNSTVETTVTFGEGEAESATLQDVIRLE